MSKRSGLRGTRIRNTSRRGQRPPRRDHGIVFIDGFVRHRAGRDPHLSRLRLLAAAGPPAIPRSPPAPRNRISGCRPPSPAPRPAAGTAPPSPRFAPESGPTAASTTGNTQRIRKYWGRALSEIRPLTIARPAAGAMHFAEEIRPDLRLRDNHQRRLQARAARAAPPKRSPPARTRFRPRCRPVSVPRSPVPRVWRSIRKAATGGTRLSTAARTPGRPAFRPSKLHATRSRPDQSV